MRDEVEHVLHSVRMSGDYIPETERMSNGMGQHIGVITLVELERSRSIHTQTYDDAT